MNEENRGELVKKWREYKGWSVERLVEEIKKRTGNHIGRVSITRWEKGQVEPRDNNLSYVAEAMGIDYQDFLAGPDNYAPPTRRMSGVSEFMCEIYSLDGIRRDLTASRWLGLGFPNVSPRVERRDIFLLYIDKQNPFFRFGMTVLCNIETMPRTGDRVLVWDPEQGPLIEEFRQGGYATRRLYGVVS